MFLNNEKTKDTPISDKLMQEKSEDPWECQVR